MSNHTQFHEQFQQLFMTVTDLADKFERGCRPAEETIIDDVELCHRLNVSKRTTATSRSMRLIEHSMIKGKIYYIYSDVLTFIKKHSVATLDRSLKIKLKRKDHSL